MNWKARAAAVRWNIQPFIHGRYRESTSSQSCDDIDPATERSLCQFSAGSAADVDAAVRAARSCFDSGAWSELPPVKRADILMRLAEGLVTHREELALLDSLEMGKPIQASLLDAGKLAPDRLRSFAGFADRLAGTSAPLDAHTIMFNTYEPRGVIGAITPWNFPTVNAVLKLAPALVAGNTMVLKPSELSPSSALKIAELALEAGMPEGVLNVVPGLGSTVGEALALHWDVDMISFTGSTITGRKIMELSGRSNGKPLMLECGGKSAQIVFEDADDLERIADAVSQSAFHNQGQVCSAHTRLVVHERIKDALVEKILRRVGRYRPGHPLVESTTFGPLASPAQRDRVRSYIEQGLKAGARAVLLGTIGDTGNGCYVSPTVFDDVDMKMSIAREEIFGPVLCIQRFATEAEAVALANGTDYGLQATVWTRDIGRGRRLARALRVGGVFVRTSAAEGPPSGYIVSREPRKASGFGSEVGLRALESYSTLKSVSFTGA